MRAASSTRKRHKLLHSSIAPCLVLAICIGGSEKWPGLRVCVRERGRERERERESMYMCVCVCMCVCMHVYDCLYVFLSMYLCIYVMYLMYVVRVCLFVCLRVGRCSMPSRGRVMYLTLICRCFPLSGFRASDTLTNTRAKNQKKKSHGRDMHAHIQMTRCYSSQGRGQSESPRGSEHHGHATAQGHTEQ